jgi:formate dehydrogenase subunit gamma
MAQAQEALTPVEGAAATEEVGRADSLKREETPEYFARFSVDQRLQHFLLVIAFTMLVLTGLPQKFSTTPWAEWIVLHLGGIDTTRFLHRIFAVLMMAVAVSHILSLVVSLVRGRLRPTMVPSLRDFQDVFLEVRYSLGLTDQHPHFDRFEYRQKFEYWGIIFGTVVITATGLILWFPVTFTRFLSGEVVPAAREAHGGEALLALLTIVIWHLYSVLFSPLAFPGDTSIFTGRISRERMMREHPREYDRIMAERRAAAEAARRTAEVAAAEEARLAAAAAAAGETPPEEGPQGGRSPP